MNTIFNNLGLAKETRLRTDINAMMDALDIDINECASRTGKIVFADAASPEIAYGEGIIARQLSLLSLLSQNLLDAAIVGSETLVEYNSAQSRGDQCCRYIGAIGTTQTASRFSIACRQDMEFSGPADLNGQRIVTSCPGTLALDLGAMGVTPGEVIAVKGDAEIVARMMGIPYVADVVETGNSLRANGYREARSLRTVRTVLAVSTDRAEEYGRTALETTYADFLYCAPVEATRYAAA